MLSLLLSSLAVLLPHATVRHVCSLPRAVGTARNEHSTSGRLQGGGAPVRAALRWCKRAPGPMATAELLPEEEEEDWIRKRLPEEEEEDWIRQRREEEDRSFQARRDAQRRVRAAAWDEEVAARRRSLWEEEARAAEAEQQQQQQPPPQQQQPQQQARQQQVQQQGGAAAEAGAGGSFLAQAEQAVADYEALIPRTRTRARARARA